jgi:hypothetical protein
MTDLNARELSIGNVAELIPDLGKSDLDNWQDKIPLGELIQAGKRTFRRYSIMEAAQIALTLALTGRTLPGSRQRTYMIPKAASGVVSLFLPLNRYVQRDSEGYLEERHASEQWFLIARSNEDDHLIAEVINGADVADMLGTFDQQLMVIPLTRLLHRIVNAAEDLLDRPEYPDAIARLASGAESAVVNATAAAEASLTTSAPAEVPATVPAPVATPAAVPASPAGQIDVAAAMRDWGTDYFRARLAEGDD